MMHWQLVCVEWGDIPSTSSLTKHIHCNLKLKNTHLHAQSDQKKWIAFWLQSCCSWAEGKYSVVQLHPPSTFTQWYLGLCVLLLRASSHGLNPSETACRGCSHTVTLAPPRTTRQEQCKTEVLSFSCNTHCAALYTTCHPAPCLPMCLPLVSTTACTQNARRDYYT